MNRIFGYFPIALLILVLFLGKDVYAQSNISPASAKVIATFPHLEKDINTGGGGIAVGMGGNCNNLSCCAVLVYKVIVPYHGSLRIKNSNYTHFSGSIIAFVANVPNPQSWSQLTYYPAPGNGCGFNETMQLGFGYNWETQNWASTSLSNTASPGEYYVLVFNENQQANGGIGSLSDFSFEFVPFCPSGTSCAMVYDTICNSDGYPVPSGTLYSQSGNYQDILPEAAAGGKDSMIYTLLTVQNTALNQDNLQDTVLCLFTDTLRHEAYTESVSYAGFEPTNGDWIQIDSVIPAIAGTDRSVFMWMRTQANFTGYPRILAGINTDSGANVCHLQIGSNGQLGIFDGTGSLFTGAVVKDGKWHHVGYTYDEGSDSMRVYVDGLLRISYMKAQTVSATDRFSIGQKFDPGLTTGNFFEGELTEISIWNQVLDSAGIALLGKEAIGGSHPQYAALQAYYPMNLTCGTSLYQVEDVSVNGFHGLASSADLQSGVYLGQVPGFNSVLHFDKKWTRDSVILSTADRLELTSYLAGTYALELSREYLSVTDSWMVSLDPTCICVPTHSSINPVVCGSYSSPSGKYLWTSSNTYTDTIPNSVNCDSIITVHLTVNKPSSATIYATACASYLSPSGQYLWTGSGTYTDILPNAANCDSVITVHLTVHPQTGATISATACERYLSPSGQHIWTHSGIYTDTLRNAWECDSLITVNLTVNEVDVEVTTDGATLSADAPGAVYRWLDCWSGYSPIPNETGQTFTATEIGSYAVEIWQNNCVDTSACVEILTVSLDGNEFPHPVIIYPNPNQGVVYMNLGELRDVSIRVFDARGILYHQDAHIFDPDYDFALDAASGIYLIEVIAGGKTQTYKLLKQ